jgi:anti-anti-sigma factor
MNLEVSAASDGVTRVRLVGRLDAPGADAIDLRFNAAIVAAGRPAVVDLSQVDFIASMGIRLLVGAARGLQMKGSRLALYGAQGFVRDVLQQTAIDQIIPMADTEPEALARLED